MPIAMEESSNYECSESHQSGGFFAVTKERRALMLANSGRLQEMLSGQVPMPGAVNADTSGKKQDEDNETDMDKEEEDFLDEENE